jgi:endonuclease/exonuclease/phosphatase family metal-dependent hydrolase
MVVSDASVFLLAEVRLLQCDIPAAISWCRRRGFSSLFEPAAPSTLGGMPSGGVAIVAKAELGLVPVNDVTCIVPHRAVGGAIDVPTLGHVALVAVYLDVADKWGSGNLALMAQVGAFLTTAALPFFIGGDFNNDPGSCTALSFHAWLGSVVVAPADGTCRSSAGTWSVIDYAIVNASLAWFVQSVTIDSSWPAGPHRPVRYCLHGDIGNKIALAFPTVVRYPTDAPFGPAPRPQSFCRANRAAWSAWSACVQGDRREASRLLHDGYRTFARFAERHVAFATVRPHDGEVTVGGRWGGIPQPRWQKVHV